MCVQFERLPVGGRQRAIPRERVAREQRLYSGGFCGFDRRLAARVRSLSCGSRVGGLCGFDRGLAARVHNLSCGSRVGGCCRRSGLRFVAVAASGEGGDCESQQ